MSSPSPTIAPAPRWRTGQRTWGGTVIQSLDASPVKQAPAFTVTNTATISAHGIATQSARATVMIIKTVPTFTG